MRIKNKIDVMPQTFKQFAPHQQEFFLKYILFTDFANTSDSKLEPLKSYCSF